MRWPMAAFHGLFPANPLPPRMCRPISMQRRRDQSGRGRSQCAVQKGPLPRRRGLMNVGAPQPISGEEDAG